METILLTHNFAILYKKNKTKGGMFLKGTELSMNTFNIYIIIIFETLLIVLIQNKLMLIMMI